MNSYRLIKKNCKHLHAEREGISSELILEKKILKLNIMMKNSKNYWFAQMDFQRLAGPRNVSVDLNVIGSVKKGTI